jgi:hypothetical protein
VRLSQGGAFYLREGLLDDAAAFDQDGLCVSGAACVDLTGIFTKSNFLAMKFTSRMLQYY